jgi:hypothetical protein
MNVFDRLGVSPPMSVPTGEEAINLVWGYLQTTYEDHPGYAIRAEESSVVFDGYYKASWCALDEKHPDSLVAAVRVHRILPSDPGIRRALRAKEKTMALLYLVKPWQSSSRVIEFVQPLQAEHVLGQYERLADIEVLALMAGEIV